MKARVVKRGGTWWVLWDGKGYPFVSQWGCIYAIDNDAGSYVWTRTAQVVLEQQP